MLAASELTFLIVFGVVFAFTTRLFLRPVHGAGAYWLAGWVAAGLAGVLVLVADEVPWLALLTYPLGTLFPWLLLAGSFALGGRQPPRWILPAALAGGGVRLALAASGHVQAAYAVALAVEPWVTLTAGWVAWRAVPREHAGRAERLVGPGFALLALAGAVHVAWLMLGRDPRPRLVLMWMLVMPPILALQLYVATARARRMLENARVELERRVAERTAELAEANAALRLSEERYRAVSELSSDFSFSLRIDRDLRLTREWMTGAFQRITGAPPEALDGHGWLGFLTPERRQSLRAEHEHAARPGMAVAERALRLPDGSERLVEIRVQAVRGAGDGSLRVVGAARDVTEARRVEAERRQLERHVHEVERLESLGRLSGGIAHDFNNLLSVVLGNCGLLAADLPADAAARTRLARIRTAAEHAARLTEQMLIYAGKAPTNRKVIDVSRVVRDMVELVQAVIPDECTLELDLDLDTRIEADETQVRQVILNLVTNAAESLDGGRGRIGLRSARFRAEAGDLVGAHGAPDVRPGDYVLLEVQDDGCGMDAATRERLFEPFFSTKFSGRGMGLSSVLGIVRAHAGAVTLVSEPGRGTVVRVLFPPCAGAEAQVGSASQPEAAPRPGGRILVVDDDPAVLEVASEFLGRAGFRVLGAVGGREGVERLRADPAAVDAVLLDVAMPGVGGEQAFLEMREIRPDLPIVLATGYSEELVSRRFSAPGSVGFLRKPFEPEELSACMHAALGRAKAGPR